MYTGVYIYSKFIQSEPQKIDTENLSSSFMLDAKEVVQNCVSGQKSASHQAHGSKYKKL
jgi:hypothetical protein